MRVKYCCTTIAVLLHCTAVFYGIVLLQGSLAQPKMMVVGDTNDMFMPLLDGFLCEPSESEEMIESLMQQIPAMFAETRETETILAPAIQAGLEALKVLLTYWLVTHEI
jgi:protein transport protein SEC24